MDYCDSLAYLNSFYNLEKIMRLQPSRRWKLDRMKQLLRVFGNPEKSFCSIGIVGTKGKGSTGFFLQSILNQAAVPTGFFSSPHLESPRERIRICGKIISETLWSRLLTQIRSKLKRTPCDADHGEYTYFEILMLLAALAFKESGIQAAVFEAGMGGRLDAINTLKAPIIVVTPIHLDHQEFLGRTLSKIAREKAAVIHAGTQVILMPQGKPAERMIRRRANWVGAAIFPVEHKVRETIGLVGEHQAWNAQAAVMAADVFLRGMPMGRRGISPQCGKSAPESVKTFERVVKAGLRARDWPARFEQLPGSPQVILDGAHNPAAVSALVKTLQRNDIVKQTVFYKKKFSEEQRVLIFGVTSDKDSKKMLERLASFFSKIILVPLPSGRSKSVEDLMAEAQAFFKTVVLAQKVEEALIWGRSLAGPQGLLVITGSFYLAGTARAILAKKRRSFK